MKNLILSAIILAFAVTSCNKKVKEEVTIEKTETTSQLYACPMHPEITGTKEEKCSKCGMNLEKKVTETSTETVKYACPMDPEITGKKGDVCSKCGMDLEEVK